MGSSNRNQSTQFPECECKGTSAWTYLAASLRTTPTTIWSIEDTGIDLRDYLRSPSQTSPQLGTDVEQTKTSDQPVHQNLPPHYGPDKQR